MSPTPASSHRSDSLVDALLSMIITPAAHLMLSYRKRDASRFPLTTSRLRQIGVFPVRNHYFEPLFDDRLLVRDLSEDRDLPGLDLAPDRQLAFLASLTHGTELAALNLWRSASSPLSFCIDNGSFESGDADMLYQVIRQTKPRKFVEIGSGSFTKLARLALARNHAETGIPAHHVCIEPFEQSWLESMPGIELIRKCVEDCGIDWATELGDGDLLFVDSSHIIRPQGDVLTEYLHIFPKLAKGVIVHVHDIFTPKDYPRSWVVDSVRLWNEQYLLEAVLSNTARYEVVAALNWLKHHHYTALARVCPYLTPDREPGSFWFRVKH